MEPVETKVDEPFGRQPKPVNVTVEGDGHDVDYWLSQLMYRAKFKGDDVKKTGRNKFRIFPRAVND